MNSHGVPTGYLPYADRAEVAERKVVSYLLAPDHVHGGGKATFFLQHGFRTTEWEAFRDALLRHARDNEVARRVETPYGTTYIVDGPLMAPDGRRPVVRVVWFVETGEDRPRLVTAYPVRRR